MTILGYALSCAQFHPHPLVVRTAHAVWPSAQLPGELGQNLPTTAHFEQASSLVAAEALAQAVPAVQQIGEDRERFFDFWESGVVLELTA